MSSTTKGLRRVGVTGVAALVAVGGFIGSATLAQAKPITDPGSIGIVDTVKDTASNTETEGATLLQPGVNGQALDDVQFVIPGNFKKGDTVDLNLFDRSVTSATPAVAQVPAQKDADGVDIPGTGSNAVPEVLGNIGDQNADASHLVRFSGTPTVSVKNQDSNSAVTTGPVFSTSLAQSSNGKVAVNDIVRLTITGQAGGTPGSANWVVTLSGLKVDLGADVTPGELRVAPFGYNNDDTVTDSTAATWFGGNKADLDGSRKTFDPSIATYTVPAYVAPVAFNVGTPNNVVADGTTQQIGDITIGETNGVSLQNGDYKVTVGGAATLQNDNGDNAVTLSYMNAAGKAVSTKAAVAEDGTISFTLGGLSDDTKTTVKLSGVQLSAENGKGAITYSLSGGSFDQFMAVAGKSGAIGNPTTILQPDTAFGAAASQDNIQPPSFDISSVAVPLATRIGGNDRYETAAKIALNATNDNRSVVLASGENFPDALSSGYLASQSGSSILLTKKDSLPAITAATIQDLGVRTVYVVGGTSAVSDAVVKQLQNDGYYGPLQVIRLGGADRYATNKVVNQFGSAAFKDASPVGRTTIKNGQASKLTALVATGDNYPDALAAGAATAGNGTGALPLILTKGNALSADAATQFTNLGIKQAVVVGGADVVSTAVETSLQGLGASTYRLAGDDRYATAAAVADFERADVTPSATKDGGLGFHSTNAYLATGGAFADALAAAPLAGGRNGSPILLTKSTSLSDGTNTWLRDNAASFQHVIALGLGSAVSQSTLDAANAAISGN